MAISVRGARVYQDGRATEMISSPYTDGPFPQSPRFLVMHFTFGSTARSSAEWFRDPKNPGSSAQIVIDRDGLVLQCVPLDRIAWHAGRSTWRGISGLNSHSIGIELANWGYLKRTEAGWMSYGGRLIADAVLARHKNGNPDGSSNSIGWEPYPAVQFNVAVEAAKAIINAFPSIREIVGHDDIAPDRKWDPGPAFDMDRFRSRVLSGRGINAGNEYVVNSPTGLNLRRGPAIASEVIKLLADGTRVLPIERHENWVLVTVLNTGGVGTDTGWLHSAYLVSP